MDEVIIMITHAFVQSNSKPIKIWQTMWIQMKGKLFSTLHCAIFLLWWNLFIFSSLFHSLHYNLSRVHCSLLSFFWALLDFDFNRHFHTNIFCAIIKCDFMESSFIAWSNKLFVTSGIFIHFSAIRWLRSQVDDKKEKKSMNRRYEHTKIEKEGIDPI